MTIKINDYRMASDTITDLAVYTQCGWAVSTVPHRQLTYNQAITAMILAEELAAGRPEDDPHVQAWRAELTERL